MKKVLWNALAILGIVFLIIVLYTKIFGVNKKWNRDVGIDMVNGFHFAYVQFADGNTKVIPIQSWRDYDNSDQIQITEEGTGISYLLNSSRVILTTDRVIWKDRPNVGDPIK